MFPQRVTRDLCDDDLALQEDSRGTGTIARPDLDPVERLDERVRQAPARRMAQRIRFGEVEGHRTERVRGHAFRGLGDGLEGVREVHVAGDALEDAPLAGREGLRALALGDVGDAAADQAATRRGQADEADLAGDVVIERVAMQPLEARRLAGQRPLDVLVRHAERWHAVGLFRRTDLLGPDGQQFLAGHLEEPHRIVVALDEAAGVDVEYDDRLWRILDESAVAGFAVADGDLGVLAVGRVAQADDEQLTLVQPHLADTEFGVEQRAVAVPAPGRVGRKVDLRVVQGLREFLQGRRDPRPARERRDQHVEAEAPHVRLLVAEDAFAGGVECLDTTALVNRQDRVLDVVEDGLELGRSGFAYLAREGAGLIGQPLHRSHDAPALVVPFRVSVADRLQQPPQIERAVLLSAFLELLLEQGVEAHGCDGGQGRAERHRRRRGIGTRILTDCPLVVPIIVRDMAIARLSAARTKSTGRRPNQRWRGALFFFRSMPRSIPVQEMPPAPRAGGRRARF